MYIGDINFDYSGMRDYKSYSQPYKAEFRRGTRVNKIADVLPKVILKAICDEMSDEEKTFDYIGLTAINYSPIKTPMITKVIFHDPATIVYWQDKTRTVVKCKDGETFDKEKGLAMCISKKLLGPEFHSEFRKYTEDKEVEKGGEV